MSNAMFSTLGTSRRYLSAVLLASVVSFLIFRSLIALDEPLQLAVHVRPLDDGQQLLTWVMPGSAFWNVGLRPGDLVQPIPTSMNPSEGIAFKVAGGTSAERTVSIVRPWSRSNDLALIALGVEFLVVGLLVFLLATHRFSATRFWVFAAIGAITMVIAPATSAQHPWAYYLEWLTNDSGAAAFAIFFLSTPVQRWRWLRRAIIWSFPPLLVLYSYAVMVDPSIYEGVKPLSFAYLTICMVSGVTALVWPFVSRAPKEQRRLWPVAVCSGIAAALFVGGSLLPFLFFQRYLIPPTLAILNWGLVPISIMWALLNRRFLGVTLDTWSLFRIMFETITDAVFVIGSDGRPVFVSKAGREMLGTLSDAQLNAHFGQIAENWEVKGDENTATTSTLFQRLLDGKTFRDEEQLVRRPDGRVSCVSIAGTPSSTSGDRWTWPC